MLEEVRSYFEELQSISKDDRLLVAISGGRDSIALSHVLHELGYDLGLAHVNYKLRGEESDGDADFVKAFSEQLKLPFFEHVGIVEEGKNVQSEARNIRYAFFDALMKEEGFSFIVTAHHEDDKIETSLLNLTRGTGIHGMRGMASSENILRPLLNVSREEIDEYVTQHDLEIRDDSSNESSKYKRNKLRNEIIPSFLTLEDDTRSKLLTSIRNLEEDSLAVDQMAEALLEKENDILKFRLSSVPPGSTSTWLYHAVRKLGFNRQQCIDLLRSPESGAKVSSESHTLHKHKSEVHVIDRNRISFSSMQFESFGIKKNSLAEVELSDKKTTNTESNNWEVSLAEEAVELPITIRTAKDDDRFKPLGMAHEVKLTKYLKDKGIASHNRLHTPIACDARGTVFWIPGLQIADGVKLKTTDAQCLSISFIYL